MLRGGVSRAAAVLATAPGEPGSSAESARLARLREIGLKRLSARDGERKEQFRKLVIGGLSFETTEESLRNY